jgi:hypothetical protein
MADQRAQTPPRRAAAPTTPPPLRRGRGRYGNSEVLEDLEAAIAEERRAAAALARRALARHVPELPAELVAEFAQARAHDDGELPALVAGFVFEEVPPPPLPQPFFAAALDDFEEGPPQLPPPAIDIAARDDD